MSNAAGTLRITQVRSAIGASQRTKDTLRALGLKGHQRSVQQTDTQAIRGMIAKVGHLVRVEDA